MNEMKNTIESFKNSQVEGKICELKVHLKISSQRKKKE
jgi:hypothetical protein